MDYRVQRLKEDLTNAQQRNKKQKIQLANYKKVHERDLETIKKYKEIIDKANNKLNSFIECCKAEKLESGSDYLHHEYWDMFERFNKQIKDILKEVE